MLLRLIHICDTMGRRTCKAPTLVHPIPQPSKQHPWPVNLTLYKIKMANEIKMARYLDSIRPRL